MAISELRRTPVSQMPPAHDFISMLALKAESILGYSGLREKLGVAPASLTRVLEELEIEPHCPEGVKNYKAEKNREVEAQLWDEFRAQILEDLEKHGVVRRATSSAPTGAGPAAQIQGRSAGVCAFQGA